MIQAIKELGEFKLPPFHSCARPQPRWEISKGFGMENGELLFPKEKKRIEIKLDDERREKLKNAIEEIREIIKKEKPPPAQKIKFCKNCAHKEFCWS